MRGIGIFVLAALAAAVWCWGPAHLNAAEKDSASSIDKFALVCPIEGDIDDGVSVLVKRAVEREAAGAAAVVFVIDTFGGRVDSAIDISESIISLKCPSIAFLKGKGAISAGALISYSCDRIFMAPGTNIGASTPYAPMAEVSEQVTEKSMSYLRAKYRALGELKGHDPLLGEAMVDPDVEIIGFPTKEKGWTFSKLEGPQKTQVLPSDGNQPEIPPPHPVDVFFDALGAGKDPSVQPVREAIKDAMGQPRNPSQKTEKVETVQLPQVENTIVPVEGKIISPAGKLLTLTAKEAVEYGLAEPKADTFEAVMANSGFGGLRQVNVTMRWDELLFAFLTTPLIAGLLLMCGVGCIYLEIKTPGIGWAGAVGAICLAVFFGSRLVIGMADWFDIALLLTGLVLIVAEVLFFPGFGLAGIAGMFCLFAGIYLALTRVTLPQYDWDYMRLMDAGMTLIVTSFTLILFLLLVYRFFPRSTFGRALIQSHEQRAEVGYTVQTRATVALAVGLRGTAATMLRPAGRGRFGDVVYDVMTEGDFIEPGRPIEIIMAEGNRYVVKEVNGEQ